MARLLELWLLIESCLATTIAARNSLDKRASNECPSADYTAQNGLTFTTSNLCLQNLPGLDTTNVQGVVSIYDCMDLCAAGTGSRACGGISYNFEAERCWLKNASISVNSRTVAEAQTHSALVTNFVYDPTDVTCPYTNGTQQTTVNGMTLEIRCFANMRLNDYCASDAPRPARSDGVCPYHTETMGECLEICSRAHPTCKGVSFNPDMSSGYGNCYLKSEISTANVQNAANTAPTSHFAAAVNIPTLDQTCNNATTTTSPNGENFRVTCDDNRGGNDLIQVHSESLTECLDACTSFNNATLGQCVGAMWDSTMRSGWQNCWLKGAQGTSATVTGAVFAQRGATGDGTSPSPSSTPAPGSGSGSGSTSKAWIAGVVVGIVAAVALIAFAIWWFRRRRQTQTAVPLAEMPADSLPVYAKEKRDDSGQFHELADPKIATTPPPEPQQLASEQVHELPAVTR